MIFTLSRKKDNLIPNLNREPRVPWYYGIGSVFVAIFLLGPFAFPLLWKSPRFSRTWKIIITLAVIAATVYLTLGTWHLIEILIQELKRLQTI